MTDHNLFTVIPYKDELLSFSAATSARAYYKNHYIDLLTGETHEFEVEGWLQSLDFKAQNHHCPKRVIHLFYELGFIFENLSEEIESIDLLGIDIFYTKIEKYHARKKAKKILLSLISAPHFNDYKKQFDDGYNELVKGNCYQFNLTGEYLYNVDVEAEASDFISALWGNLDVRGAYGSATYSEHLEKMFLSNSPECLFQYSEGSLVTRPIKGTVKRNSDDKKSLNLLWKELIEDKKSEAELYMITDLLRNDLCRIEKPIAVVTKKKAPLLVPGLLHQFSEIEIALSEKVTLKTILEKMFPGGSITGAPKKRVMQILKKLEKRSRGFYCGSTIIFSDSTIESSINIRSSTIDFKNHTLNYQAGGGITLMSNVTSEFEEMTYKHDSYIDILTL